VARSRVLQIQEADRWLAVQPPNLSEAVLVIPRVVADAHRASQVIARMRGFVRGSETRRAAIDLREVLRDVESMVESEARARNVRLRIEPQGQVLPRVIGDRVQLLQVVLNLAMNGIEAMAAVPEAQRCLQLRVERDGLHMLRVSVRDAGTGLLGAARDRALDAFYTSRPTGMGMGMGMGMGLTISRSIVEAHEGRLWCTPNEDGGETFSFTLPI
jgi:signal transduction histidine kinase